MSGITAYWLSVGLLAAGGVGLAYALLFDWLAQRVRRGRRRQCPKCWYDMSHTPGLRCSECGYSAKRERQLFKARRRWAVASLGIVLLVGSYAARVAPDVQDRGWPAAVPTTVLIIALPWLEVPPVSSISDAQRPNVSLARSELLEELRSIRMSDGRMPKWQRKMLLRRAASIADSLVPVRAPASASGAGHAIIVDALSIPRPGSQPFLD